MTILSSTKLFSQKLTDEFITNFSGLVKDKRIVLLSEMSHREGSVIKTNTELVKYLHQKKGFNLILFESGFIDLGFFSRTDSTANYRENLSDAIFPVWTKSEEFQPLLDYLAEQKKTLEVGGFDLQFSSDHMYSSFIDSLRLYTPIEDKEKWESFFYVFDGVVNEAYYPFKEYPLGLYISKINKLSKLVEGDDFLQQGLKNYKEYLLILKSGVFEVEEKDFKAKMANPRDLQMAKNVIYYANKYPKAKIICWGASAHFAQDFSSFENEEIKAFKPMGGEIAKELGKQVISIGYTGGTGSYKYWFEDINEAKRVVLNYNGKFEDDCNKMDSITIIDLNTTHLKDSLFSSSSIEYTPLKGKWSEVFDAIIFQKEITPMHQIEEKQDIQFDTSFITNSYPLITSTKILKKTGAYKRGEVLNQVDGTPVSFCLLKIKGTQAGTVCDVDGKYEISIKPGDTLLLSSSGYEKKEIVFNGLNLDFNLKPSEITLNELTIFSEGNFAEHIFNKVLENLDKNYDLKPYNLDFFVRHKITRNNKLRYNYEYFGQYYFSYYGNEANSMITENRLFDFKPFKSFYFSAKKFHHDIANPILTNSIFQNKQLKKYNFELIEDDRFYLLKVYPKKQRYSHIKEEFYITINPIDYAVLEFKCINITDPKIMTDAFYKLYKRNDKNLLPLQLSLSERIYSTKYNKNFNGKYDVVYGVWDNYVQGYNEFLEEDVNINDHKVYIPYNKTNDIVSKCNDKEAQDSQYGTVKYNKDFWDNFNVPKIALKDQLIY
ncbi:carboxypeptidase-like regulatory domain-containing protein [Flammeovirga pectinis]|nr:erythromycin esterase family protein [Flammeovirga pectinis]